jgi:hypothetical protein
VPAVAAVAGTGTAGHDADLLGGRRPLGRDPGSGLATASRVRLGRRSSR